MQRIILHVDLDYFFAQCEEKRNPSLKGKPVIVCVFSGRTADSGAVSAANYIARAKGVRAGLPIALAKKAIPEGIFLPVDHGYYGEVSDRIMAICSQFADAMEQVGIDEAFLDVTKKSGSNYDKAASIARTLKYSILEQEQLTCSVGIAPNKLIAKIASDFKKPDGLTVVKPEQVGSFLGSLPVSKIPGIGKKTSEALEAKGIAIVKQLSVFPVHELVSIFGKARGTMLHEHSLGIDESPVETFYERKQLSRILTLKKDASIPAELFPVIDYIAETLVERLKEEKAQFKTVSIIAIDKNLESQTRSKTLQAATESKEKIAETATELVKKFFEEKPKELRRFGIALSNLSFGEKQKKIFEF